MLRVLTTRVKETDPAPNKRLMAYGLLFLSHEKAATAWSKGFNGRQKRYSVISVILRIIRDVWHAEYLLTFFETHFAKGGILLDIH